jgi:hypothetical protein
MNQIADDALAIVIAMSALPPRADVVSPAGHVRKVPLPDSCIAATSVIR